MHPLLAKLCRRFTLLVPFSSLFLGRELSSNLYFNNYSRIAIYVATLVQACIPGIFGMFTLECSLK